MKLIITVDSEADNQWNPAAPLTTANLEQIPRFQALCDRFEFPPTYLCTHEVATSKTFAKTLLRPVRDGRAEIGAHLHPWSTPPVDERWDQAGRARTYPSELPDDVLHAKLTTLTAAIGERVGTGPTSYRAGRWGFSAAQVKALCEMGYEVDCSVTPLVSWVKDRGLQQGGPDYSRAPLAPYPLSRRNVCRPGKSSLLEVPVTILHTSGAMRRSRKLRRWFRRRRRSWAARAGDRFFHLAPQWFRPFPNMSAQRLIAVYDTACTLGVPAVELMLHSSELLPGGSPYNPTSAAVDDLFHRLDTTFAHLVRRGAEGITLTDFARSRAKVPSEHDGEGDFSLP